MPPCARLTLPVTALIVALALPAFADGPVTVGQSFGSRMKDVERRMLWEGARDRREMAEQARAALAREAAHPRPRAHAARAKHGVSQSQRRFERAMRPAPTGDMSGGAGQPGTRMAQPFGMSTLGPFPANVRANGSDPHAGSGQSETSVAVIGNNVVVAWNDGEGFYLPNNPRQGWGYSTDGGQHFTDGGTPPLTALWSWFSDPVMSADEKTGTFYFAAMADSGGDTNPFGTNGMVVVPLTFPAGAPVWGTPRIVRRFINSQSFLDKPWMCADSSSGNVYVSYTVFTVTADEIDFQRGAGGNGWNAPVKLSSTPDNGLVQGSRVAVGPAGEVYAVWYAIGTDTTRAGGYFRDYFRVRRSTDHGASFGGQVNAASLYSNFSSGAPGFNRPNGITFPSLAVDRTHGPFSGRVYVGWNESINFYDDELGAGPTVNEIEPNNRPEIATPFVIGGNLRGAIPALSDTDFFAFPALAGQTIIAYTDSLDASLDMSLRLVAGDGTTQLAYSRPGAGINSLVVFTVPLSGTYYLRVRGFAGGGGYHIATGFDTPGLNDRARDHRDAFVAWSANGTSWATPVRVSGSPVGYDDWLPEVAVSGLNATYGDGHVYAAWYDWRDSDPATCGGQSSIYLSRSDNGGVTWQEIGRISDVRTSWSNVDSNIEPNQGDYMSITATGDGVYTTWGDGRNGDPDVYTSSIPIQLTPVEATLLSVTATPDRVTLMWSAGGDPSAVGTIERSADGIAWSRLGSVVPDASGRFTFVDAAVTPGARLAYRLIVSGAQGERTLDPVWVDVPAAARLALAGARPNPAAAGRALWVSFSLPDGGAATLALYDVAGRRLHSLDVGTLGAGDHQVDLSQGRVLDPGVYLVRLTRGSERLVARVAVTR